MATQCFKCEVQVSSLKLELSQLFKYPLKFDPPPKNRFKTAQKVNVEPDMAT